MDHVRSVAIGMWLRTGSRDEDASNNGISHFIEHMMFKGTHARTARQIAESIDESGGQLNAFTSKDHTCYYARVLDEHVELATDILADMILHSTFPDEEMEKEKDVIIEEIKMYEDTPDESVHDMFAQVVLNGHPLGRCVLGTVQNVRRIDRAAVQAYLDQRYTGDNLVVAASGHLDHDQVVTLVRRHFAGLPRGGSETQRSVFRVGQDKIRKKRTEQVHVCMGSPGIARDDLDKYAVATLDTALGGGLSSRFFQELREDRGLVYSTYSYHTAFQDTGLFTIYAGVSPEHASKVVSLIRDICRRTAEEGLRGDELQRAKEQLKGGLMLGLENTTNRMSRLAKAELFDEELPTPDELIERIEAVQSEDVLRAARRLFGSGRLSLAAIGPAPAAFAGYNVPQQRMCAGGY